MKTTGDLPVFMGICESALMRGDGVLQDFYAVGDIIFLPFFPQKLNGLYLLVGLPGGLIGTEKEVRFIIQEHKNPLKKAWTDLGTISVVEPPNRMARINGYSKPYLENAVKTTGEQDIKLHKSRMWLIPPDIVYKLIPVPCPPLFVIEPGEIDVIVKIKESDFLIGHFSCTFCQTPTISEEERTAIMSRPGAFKTLVYRLGCKKCHDKKDFHITLDKSIAPPAYQEAGTRELRYDTGDT